MTLHFMQKEGYKCTVKVTGFPEDRTCWYIGCRTCKTAVKGDIATFQCNLCERSETKTLYAPALLSKLYFYTILLAHEIPCSFLFSLLKYLHISYINSYKLSFTAEDETAEAKFFAYDAQARAIIKRDAVAVAKQQAKEPGFPRFLAEAISRKFTFHILLTEDSYSDVDDKTWLVKSVLVDHEFEAFRAAHRLQIQAANMPSSGLAPAVSATDTVQAPPDVVQPLLVQDIITSQPGSVGQKLPMYLRFIIYNH
jgi:hypothetical protein